MTDPQDTRMDRYTLLAPCPLPEITDELRERARQQPGQWMAFEDPAAPTDRPVPKFAIQGGYEVDADGELTGRYKINPLYNPSPQVAGMILNDLELVLWRVLHGYNPMGYLVDMLYRAELSVYAEYDGDERMQVAQTSDGRRLLQVFTSDRFVPEEWPHHRLVPGWTVFEAMADSVVFLDINPGTDLSLQMMIRDLAGLVIDRTRQSQQLGTRTQDAGTASPYESNDQQ